MTDEAAERMLDKTLSEVRQKGKDEWNMTDNEIDQCIYAFLEDVAKEKSTPKSLKGKLWRAVKFAFKIWLVFLALLVCFSVYLDYDQETEKELALRFLGQFMDYNYPLFRALRKVGLPIVQRYNLSAYYDELCLVDNPYFTEPVDNCEPCHKIKSIKDATGKHTMVNTFNLFKPFTVKDNLQGVVSFNYLKWIFDNNAASLRAGTAYVKSNQPTVTAVDDLFGGLTPERILKIDRQFHAMWVTRRVGAAHILRQLFNRPYFAASDAEVAIDKTVFIDGPESETYSLPASHYENVWYVQGHGTRKIILIPNIHCLKECQATEVVMNSTNVLFFNNQLWKPQSAPADSDQDEVSVGFSGSFTMTYPKFED